MHTVQLLNDKTVLVLANQLSPKPDLGMILESVWVTDCFQRRLSGHSHPVSGR